MPAVLIAIVSYYFLSKGTSGFRWLFSKSRLGAMKLPFAHWGTAAIFAAPLILGAVAFANVANAMLQGQSSFAFMSANLDLLSVSFYVMLRMMKALAQAQKGLRI